MRPDSDDTRQMTRTWTDAQIRGAIVELLDQRATDATICPSEVARHLAPSGWRPLMPQIREVAVGMARQGRLEIRQKGVTQSPDTPLRGPIRLGRKA